MTPTTLRAFGYPSIHLIEELRERGNIIIVWNLDDVKKIRPHWPRLKCQTELNLVAKALEDVSVERGWLCLESMLLNE